MKIIAIENLMRSCLCLLALLSAGSTIASDIAANEPLAYQVGFSKADITPPPALLETGDVYMGGYGSWTDRGPATGVHDALEANVICISPLEAEAKDTVCLLVVDNLGLPGPVNRAIQMIVHEKTGIPTANIWIASTHSHAAPDLLGLWGGSPKQYRQLLIDGAANAVVDAFSKRQAANLTIGTHTAKAHNRRDWGFTDETVTLVQASDANKKLIGSLLHFTAHPVVTTGENHELSSDYVHYARTALNSQTNAPVVFVNGAIGDVNPFNEPSTDMWPDTETYGKGIASAAMMTLSKQQKLTSGLKLQTEVFEVLVDNPILAWAQFFGILEDKSSGPPWDLSITTSISKLTLGDQLTWLAIPGEATTRLGLSLKEKIGTPYKMILGLTNGSLGYMIPEDEWQTGRNENYEESVSLGKHMAPEIEAALQRMEQQ